MRQRRNLAIAAWALVAALGATGDRALAQSPLAALPVPPKAPRGEIVGNNRASRRAKAAEERRRG